MRAVQVLEGLQAGVERNCNGGLLFSVAAEASGVGCTVDTALSEASPAVRGISERAGSEIAAFACGDDDAPDDIVSDIEVRLATAARLNPHSSTLTHTPPMRRPPHDGSEARTVAKHHADRMHAAHAFCTRRARVMAGKRASAGSVISV